KVKSRAQNCLVPPKCSGVYRFRYDRNAFPLRLNSTSTHMAGVSGPCSEVTPAPVACPNGDLRRPRVGTGGLVRARAIGGKTARPCGGPRPRERGSRCRRLGPALPLEGDDTRRRRGARGGSHCVARAL